MRGQTPLGLALIDAIAALAGAGAPMPSNLAMARQLGCSSQAVSDLLRVLVREGRIGVEARGKTFALRRRVTIFAIGAQTAPIEDVGATRRAIERRTAVMHAVTPSPRLREELRVTRDRCPFCEMPPGHAECRHGWDGATTHGQRRDMALSSGAARDDRAILARWAA